MDGIRRFSLTRLNRTFHDDPPPLCPSFRRRGEVEAVVVHLGSGELGATRYAEQIMPRPNRRSLTSRQNVGFFFFFFCWRSRFFLEFN